MLQRVFVDADVLAARIPLEWLALVRDETHAFQLHSSAAVVADAVRIWRDRDPAARGASARRPRELLVATLDELAEDADVDVDIDALPDGSTAHDAAVMSGAHILLSSRARETPDADLLPFELVTPDEFLCLVDDLAGAAVRNVALELARRDGAETRGSVDRLARALIAAGCPAFAGRVRAHLRTSGA
ncbi:hypothetical protein [Microbacterium sp. LWS13-1.2]|uniref:PIN domain-containing protein n=1 Tax=Microbacterium sp. LWS13-1.2 TaxID=3135264 RepID=A0AAU6SDA0_9MICO